MFSAPQPDTTVASTAPTSSSTFPEYDQFDGLGLADLVKRGEVSARELALTAIARIEALNPALNAVIHTLYDDGLATADAGPRDGPFSGVPFLIKDLLSWYAGAPIRSGSRMLDGFIAPHDSEIVRRYKRAGVVILGKTNTPEFGLTPFTEPELFGPTRNPWDLTRTSGGSSGGSAAAVAAGMVPLAGGGDGGGSIRIPASCCGLFGLKPTRGRTPTGPRIVVRFDDSSSTRIGSRSCLGRATLAGGSWRLVSSIGTAAAGVDSRPVFDPISSVTRGRLPVAASGAISGLAVSAGIVLRKAKGRPSTSMSLSLPRDRVPLGRTAPIPGLVVRRFAFAILQ